MQGLVCLPHLEQHLSTGQVLPLNSQLSIRNSRLFNRMSSQIRTLGDRTFNAVGYGGMGLSVAYGSVGTDEERLKVLDAVYASGCTFWDTADIYGDNEELIAKWYARLRR